MGCFGAELEEAIESLNMSQEEKDHRDRTTATSSVLLRRLPLRHPYPYVPRRENDAETETAEPPSMEDPTASTVNDANASVDSVEVGPSTSPRKALATPRMPVLIRDSPLSTKRERMRMTPHYRRPAPKVIKTAPPIRTICSVLRDQSPRILYYDANINKVIGYPATNAIYDKTKSTSFFEQSFTVKELLGKGSFGEVFNARSLEDSFEYAVKVSLNRIRHTCQAKYREISNHMKIPGHSNIVTFVRAWEESERLYIQTELCDMSLEHYCSTKHVLDEQEIWDIFIDILQAIHHLHENQLIHDDIKPENIFLTEDKICKLGDFGLAIDVNNPYETKNTEEGDSKYLALEVLNSKPTFASDIFSLGMTILEAATDLDLPSNGLSWKQIRQEQIPERFFDGVHPEMSLIIKWMLRFDPLQRPTARQLLEYHPVKKRLFARRAFIKYVQTRDAVRNFLFVALTWCMAFLSVVFHHPSRMFQAVAERRSAICAGLSSSTNRNPPPQQQHTPVQNPESALKVFSESFGGSALRMAANPFDVSDDESPAAAAASARRLQYPLQKTLPLARRLDWNDDDSDGQEAATTSSSNSSAVESNASPVRRAAQQQCDQQKQGTPKSARKVFGSRLEAALSGSGDGGFSQAERDAWQYAKYQRMMAMEQRLDREDAEDMIDETPYEEPPTMHALSCPPHAIMLSSGRRILKAPKLDFTLLDDKDDAPRAPAVSPKAAEPKKVKAAPKLDFSLLDDSDNDANDNEREQKPKEPTSTPRAPPAAKRMSIRARIAAAERAATAKEKK